MKWNKEIKIGERLVGDGHPTYIIAEIGSNHNQSLELAYENIDAAVLAGADAVKFQSLKYDELYEDKNSPDGIKELFKKISLAEDWHEKLHNYSREKGVDFFSAPTYPNAVDILAKLEIDVLKIASPQFGFYPEILNRAIEYGKPLIMSTGLSNMAEIDGVLRICQKRNFFDIVLLHCVTQYPTQPCNANLKVIDTYKRVFNCLVGYSDHTLGMHFATAAVVQGACVIEKHFTLDSTQDGPDHHFASEPGEFKHMVDAIRELEVGIGTGVKAELTDWEKQHKKNIELKYVAKENVKPGQRLSNEMFDLKRGKSGIDVSFEELILKTKLKKSASLEKGDFLNWSMLEFLD